MTSKNTNRVNKAEMLAQKYKMSKRRVYRCVKFYNAVQVFIKHYGDDMLDCLLRPDRTVKLTYGEIIFLAECIEMSPKSFEYLGQIIRSGNTELIKSFIYDD